MGRDIYPQIRAALDKLDPAEMRPLAERTVSIGLIASSNESYAGMEAALTPSGASRARRREMHKSVHRTGGPGAAGKFDIVLCEEELLCPRGAFPFYWSDSRRTVREVLAARGDLELALARNFRLFRQPVIARIIRKTAKENAVFALVTGLPALLPAFAELPSRIGEFTSDSPFLTMNQVRMAFLIAAASDRETGFAEQAAEIGAIVAGAVGCRGLANELAEAVPWGGGLIPKALIAYAGAYAAGVALERFYRLGSGLTREERTRVYEQAMERGREVVGAFIELRRSA
jgi:hypothetical protein